jgi:hypothetical protein
MEWHVSELFPRVGFIVTNSNMKAKRVIATPNEKIRWLLVTFGSAAEGR